MKAKLRAVFMSVALCALLFGGCQRAGTATVDQNIRTAADIRKADLQQELSKKWENPNAHFELGQLYHAAGDWSKADYHYNIAIGFNPAYRDAQAALVKLKLDRGEKSKGEDTAGMYMKQVASSPEQLLALGVAFEKQGLDEYAMKCYQEALKTAPNLHTVNRRLGYYYLAKNKKDLAKEYFIRSFQLNPNQPDVAAELGRLGVAVRIPQAPGTSSEGTGQPTSPASQSK